MLRWLDRSARLAKTIEAASAWLARRRGVLPLIGVLLVALALVPGTVNVFAPRPAWALAGLLLHSVGVLLALIGLLLAEPLGK